MHVSKRTISIPMILNVPKYKFDTFSCNYHLNQYGAMTFIQRKIFLNNVKHQNSKMYMKLWIF